MDLLSRAEAAYRDAVADPASARPVAAALVEDARRDDDIEALVVALRALAWAERTLLAGERAKELLDEAARLARHEGLQTRLGEVLVVRGAVNQELGRSRAAQRDFDQARPLLGSAALAELEHQTAVLHHNAGRLKQAAAIYRRVLADPETPAPVRAKDSNNLALIEAQFGRYPAALALLEQARALAADIGPALSAYFTESHATVLAQAGMLPASLEMFETAELLYEKAGLPRAELYAEYADVMSDLWLLPEARSAARRALEEWDANRIPLMGAEAELRVARLAVMAGDRDAAERSATRAAASFRAHARVGWAAAADVVLVAARAQAGTASTRDLQRLRRAAHTLERLRMTSLAAEAYVDSGRIALSLDRRAWALEAFDRAKALAAKAPVLVRLKGRTAAAASDTLRGDAAHALRECRAGLADLDRHRGALASAELRALASAHGAQLGEIGLRALLGSGSGLDVFRWMERTRAAALLSVERPPLEGYEEELAQLRSLQSAIQSGEATAEDQARQAELEVRLRRITWTSTAGPASPQRPAFVSEVRELLGPGALVEYGILDGAVLAVVLTQRRGVRIHHLGPLAVVQDEVERLAYLLRMLARPTTPVTADRLRPLAQQRVERLRSLLVGPLGIASEIPVVVVPVGILQQVPWSVMHDGPSALSPSAAFWVRASGRAAPTATITLLAAGPDLAEAENEVRALAGVHQDPVVLAPPDSTVAGVTAVLGQAGLAHFACHGQIRADNPMFSGLWLSDGALTVQELELRDIAPHRVVLAACEAAADATYPGGETLGFVSALLARGTAGIVASTIVVPDTAASDLMVGLHQRARDSSLSVALHEARARLNQEDPLEFVNWCGFTAYGAA